MTIDDQSITKAWLYAASDLRINVKAPFLLKLESGNTLNCLFLIKGFGSKKGTVVLSEEALEYFDVPEAYGYYCSALSLEYGTYNREIFIDTLLDWGYYGEEGLKPDFLNS